MLQNKVSLEYSFEISWQSSSQGEDEKKSDLKIKFSFK